MGTLIEVKDLKKSFDDTEVLKGVDLTVETGEVVAIIGASGSGKSTMVRCIAGLEKPDSGEIYLEDKKVEGARSTNGKVGMVFQQFNLFPHYSVGDNIRKPCMTAHKMKQEEADKLAKDMLAKVHLSEKIDAYPNNLSGGQKQRVAIARALAMRPKVVLFDEPTSSLDPELAHEVFETINDLANEGQTMLIVTHQINAIRHFVSRVIFLHRGRIEVEGTPDYIFDECDNPHLAKFLQKVDFKDL